MRLIKRFDDTKLIGVIGEITSEIQSLNRKLGEGVDSERENRESILSELKYGNETMKLMLARLEEISAEMKEFNKPWYMRVFCR